MLKDRLQARFARLAAIAQMLDTWSNIAAHGCAAQLGGLISGTDSDHGTTATSRLAQAGLQHLSRTRLADTLWALTESGMLEAEEQDYKRSTA